MGGLAFTQKSEIMTADDNNRLASVLLYKDFDCSDGVFKGNLYF